MSTTDEINFNPDAPSLTKEETAAATKELVNMFPKITRHKYDPEIRGQAYTNLSFMLLKEPKDGVYGFVKPRGTWPDGDAASADAERIISRVDSVFKINIAPTGYWSPITNNEKFALDQMDVKTREQEQSLRDRAAKEAAAKNEEMRRELRERKELLERDDDDIEFDAESLDYYTKKKVTMKELNTYIAQANEKMKTLKKSYRKLDKEIKEINKKHPEYNSIWLDNYNRAREKVGLEKVSHEEMEKPTIIGPAM